MVLATSPPDMTVSVLLLVAGFVSSAVDCSAGVSEQYTPPAIDIVGNNNLTWSPKYTCLPAFNRCILVSNCTNTVAPSSCYTTSTCDGHCATLGKEQWLAIQGSSTNTTADGSRGGGGFSLHRNDKTGSVALVALSNNSWLKKGEIPTTDLPLTTGRQLAAQNAALRIVENAPASNGLYWLVTLEAGDPSSTWEAYASFAAAANTSAAATSPHGPIGDVHDGAGDDDIALLSASYLVPPAPRIIDDTSTPKWWIGLQAASGEGVLMKPQLTWQNQSWVINTEVLDYSLTPSKKILSPALTVSPHDVIDASICRGLRGGGSYTLTIRQGSRSSSQTYQTELGETRAYAVMEHQPNYCGALPTSGSFLFDNVTVKLASGAQGVWIARQYLPACGVRANMVPNRRAVAFSWSTD